MTPSRAALLVVDAQRGFTELCPTELPVPGGLPIVPAVNRLLDLPWARIDASQDWHPPDHCSFLGQRDNLYPPHCVAGTPGAGFDVRLVEDASAGLDLPAAGLFQAQAKAEGQGIGIRYERVDEVVGWLG